MSPNAPTQGLPTNNTTNAHLGTIMVKPTTQNRHNRQCRSHKGSQRLGVKRVGHTNVITTTANHRSNNNSKTNQFVYLILPLSVRLFNPQDLENAITQFGLRKGGLAVVRGDDSKATTMECCREVDFGWSCLCNLLRGNFWSCCEDQISFSTELSS